jgi:hypothetical protein
LANKLSIDDIEHVTELSVAEVREALQEIVDIKKQYFKTF